jgi:hypothetical protein
MVAKSGAAEAPLEPDSACAALLIFSLGKLLTTAF